MDAQTQSEYKHALQLAKAWILKRHAMTYEIGPTKEDFKRHKKECANLERQFTQTLATLKDLE